ncbi:amino acid permease [Roseibium sp.]|uniref:amino acid permease n=1 Tax=Roseibium sp. TaxID=1936156 RepID=UPI003A983597
MLFAATIVLAVLITAIYLFSPKLRTSRPWRAMVTPLASIIGSGFLVLGPILLHSYGAWAPLVMLGLCAAAYAFGSAIRFNIAFYDSGEDGDAETLSHKMLEQISSWALAFAYFISVAYYLNLFGAFGLDMLPLEGDIWPRLLTSAVLALIVVVGWVKGFRSLETLEYASVTVKLAIIAGLLVGLGVFFGETVGSAGLLLHASNLTGWPALTLAFGLLITVQGFETSRYLGHEYKAELRIRSMRWAQILASVIYIAYILLIAYVFEADSLQLSETAIIDLMQVVSPVLPILLVAAALAAQFSAAIADTGGSGGLIMEASGGRVSERMSYLVLGIFALALTWTADIFEIITYASKAFAFYYLLQAAIACLSAYRSQRKARAAGFAGLVLLGVVIVIFGQSVAA